MPAVQTLDRLVKQRLKLWPQRPPGLRSRSCSEQWMRGRPASDTRLANPFLKLPGSDRLKTLPDGLWLNFLGTVEEPFVDIFAVEACSTITNLLDKRSRFAPSTHSLLAVCPVEWLLAPVSPGSDMARWEATGLFRAQPTIPAAFPVREMRVLYGLLNEHYEGFARDHLPHAHEFFVPMKILTRENSERCASLRALLSRASIASNFHSIPRGPRPARVRPAAGGQVTDRKKTGTPRRVPDPDDRISAHPHPIQPTGPSASDDSRSRA
jgi:hypothetical protein